MSKPRHVMQARLRELQQELIPASKVAVKKGQSDLSAYEKESLNIIQYLSPKPCAEPTVSDHAVLRYMERAMGFDIVAIRRSILTPERVAAIKSGATTIKADNCSFKVQSNVITTII